MSVPKNPNAAKQFVIALTIVLVGVYFGSMLALKKVDEDQARRHLPAKGLGPTGMPGTEVADSNAQIQPKTDPDTPDDFAWTNDMVWIPAGSFVMGATNGQPDEIPMHTVELNGFWMDKYEITNQKFDEFVKATEHVTV